MQNIHKLNIHDNNIADNNDGVNPENGITEIVVAEISSQNNNRKNNNTPIENLHVVILIPGHDPKFPDDIRETEETQEEVVRNSGINTHKLWSNNSDNP